MSYDGGVLIDASETSDSASAGVYAKFLTTSQVITNTAAPITPVTLGTLEIDNGGFTGAGSIITVPIPGDYKVNFFANWFDNNTARVSHGARFYVDGVQVSDSNGSYIRDANGQEECGINYFDLINIPNAGSTLEIRVQALGNLAGVTTLQPTSRIVLERA